MDRPETIRELKPQELAEMWLAHNADMWELARQVPEMRRVVKAIKHARRRLKKARAA